MALEAVLKRDGWIVAAALAALAAIAWLYLVRLSAGMPDMTEMPGMPGMAMEPAGSSPPSPATSFAAAASMWLVMMVGMMIPGAAPTILIFAAVERKRRPSAGPFGRTAIFIGGYFLLWGAFSAIAAAAQILLAEAGLLSAHLSAGSTTIGGMVFVLAGLYELTPLKNRCLSHCRSPLEWLGRRHRPGPAGALAMGIEHGAYCVGCCWVLMLLLFVAGIMNLLFVALLAGIVLAQKLLPGGRIVTRAAGVVLIACGIVLMASPIMIP